MVLFKSFIHGNTDNSKLGCTWSLQFSILCKGKYFEAEAFKKAMGKLMVSLKQDDVERLITCLYSEDVIDMSTRDQLRSPLHHQSELVRVNDVLCQLEALIQKRPRVYGELIDIFISRLQLSSAGAILRK